MKKYRFSEKQITNILKEAQGGIPVAELCRSHGISNTTFYSQRSKYGGMDASMIVELKSLQEGIVGSKRCMPKFSCKEKFFRKSCERSGEATLSARDWHRWPTTKLGQWTLCMMGWRWQTIAYFQHIFLMLLSSLLYKIIFFANDFSPIYKIWDKDCEKNKLLFVIIIFF